MSRVLLFTKEDQRKNISSYLKKALVGIKIRTRGKADIFAVKNVAHGMFIRFVRFQRNVLNSPRIVVITLQIDSENCDHEESLVDHLDERA